MNFLKRISALQWGIIPVLLMLLNNWAFSQQKYENAISDISYAKIHKNWLLVPSAVDLRVEWAVSLKEQVDSREKISYVDPEDLPFIYRVFMIEEDMDDRSVLKEVRKTNFVDFPEKKLGGRFSFNVKVFNENSMLLAESEIASIVVGSGEPSNGAMMGKSWLYYIHPGRWQLATFGKGEIYDRSTSLGKLAFIFLSITTFLSWVVLLFYSSRTLYLGNVFPYQRSTRKLLWSFSGSCDGSFTKRLTAKFKFVLDAWEVVATRSREVTVEAVKNIPQTLSSIEKMASVDVACMEYWNADGDKAIETIKDIIYFPENHENNGNGKKKPDDLLAELVIKIEDNFHDLIENGNGSYDHLHTEKQDMEKLIDEIYEPVVVDEKLLPRLRKWLLRKGIFDRQKGLRPFPTSRIIHAGLEIHRTNGHRWLKPTEEVKHAFEDRASNEIEVLKQKSKIELFWNYGTLAPLVGLFGTVTGITYAFQQLSRTAASPDFTNAIQHLSSGIFEALWTTIFGLANGIIAVVIYYYYKNKLDWIYSKWEEIYVSITEKL